MFIQDPLLLDGVGRDGPFEQFICYLYMVPNVKGGIDKARDIQKRKERSVSDTTSIWCSAATWYACKLSIQGMAARW